MMLACSRLLVEPGLAGEDQLVARRLLDAGQHMELVARLGHQQVLVGEIDDGRLDLAVHHGDDAVFRARHIAAVAELMPSRLAMMLPIASVPVPRAWKVIGWPSMSFQVLYSSEATGKKTSRDIWKMFLSGTLDFWITE